MNGKCFEIGTIQAFLDGETTPAVSYRLTTHVAACDVCARLLAEADEENSVVFSTLGRELDTLVPTQRLWSRINDTIEVEKSRVPVWQKVLVYIRVGLANPSIAAAAGVLLVLGMFGIYSLRTNNDLALVGTVNYPPASGSSQSNPAPSTAAHDPAPATTDATPSFGRSDLSPRELKSLVQNASARSSQREITPQRADMRVAVGDGYLPGEESYVKTITDLKQNVDPQKDTVLTPSTRVSYERNMAVVNDSIKRMREVVKKNPRNQAARQVLYASYQDKIDLLNSVVQREELIASLR